MLRLVFISSSSYTFPLPPRRDGACPSVIHARAVSSRELSISSAQRENRTRGERKGGLDGTSLLETIAGRLLTSTATCGGDVTPRGSVSAALARAIYGIEGVSASRDYTRNFIRVPRSPRDLTLLLLLSTRKERVGYGISDCRYRGAIMHDDGVAAKITIRSNARGVR